jgi:hypothetical protein
MIEFDPNSNDQIKSNLTWQIEANCMLFTNETKLKTKHACEQIQIEANLAS